LTGHKREISSENRPDEPAQHRVSLHHVSLSISISEVRHFVKALHHQVNLKLIARVPAARAGGNRVLDHFIYYFLASLLQSVCNVVQFLAFDAAAGSGQ
jgi:hypothetical protein